MAKLPVSYYVYGYIYKDDGTTILADVSVGAEDQTTNSKTFTTTDDDGLYILDLQKLLDCSDGNTIQIYVNESVDIYGDISSTFTLSLSSVFKQVNLTTSYTEPSSGDLDICYGTDLSSSINCWCTRWDVDGCHHTIGTILNESDYNTIVDNTTPGAIGELNIITAGMSYYDSTWEGLNTIKIEPNDHPKYTKSVLKDMRKNITLYVNNISSRTIDGSEGLMNVIIEGKTSGAGLI